MPLCLIPFINLLQLWWPIESKFSQIEYFMHVVGIHQVRILVFNNYQKVFIAFNGLKASGRWNCLVLITELPWDEPTYTCREFSDWLDKKMHLSPWKKIDPLPLGKQAFIYIFLFVLLQFTLKKLLQFIKRYIPQDEGITGKKKVIHKHSIYLGWTK